MKTFGELERDGAPMRLPALTPGALTPGRNEPPAEQPVMSASLRERVIEQIEPSVAATVSREVLRRQIRKSSMESPTRSGSNCQVASSFNWRTSLRRT